MVYEKGPKIFRSGAHDFFPGYQTLRIVVCTSHRRLVKADLGDIFFFYFQAMFSKIERFWIVRRKCYDSWNGRENILRSRGKIACDPI